MGSMSRSYVQRGLRDVIRFSHFSSRCQNRGATTEVDILNARYSYSPTRRVWAGADLQFTEGTARM